MKQDRKVKIIHISELGSIEANKRALQLAASMLEQLDQDIDKYFQEKSNQDPDQEPKNADAPEANLWITIINGFRILATFSLQNICKSSGLERNGSAHMVWHVLSSRTGTHKSGLARLSAHKQRWTSTNESRASKGNDQLGWLDLPGA